MTTATATHSELMERHDEIRQLLGHYGPRRRAAGYQQKRKELLEELAEIEGEIKWRDEQYGV
jgi:hypothetical protein